MISAIMGTPPPLSQWTLKRQGRDKNKENRKPQDERGNELTQKLVAKYELIEKLRHKIVPRKTRKKN